MGRLAEVMGEDLVELDRWHRVMGFEYVAEAILKRFPRTSGGYWRFRGGVNRAMGSMPVFPLEFWLEGYLPSVWWPEDSLSVVLAMEEDLELTGEAERMALAWLKGSGKTVVVITHDDGYFYVAGRCLRLEEGRLTEIPGAAGQRETAPGEFTGNERQKTDVEMSS